MKCTTCGSEIENNSNMCRFCGSNILTADSIKPASKKKRFLNYFIDSAIYLTLNFLLILYIKTSSSIIGDYLFSNFSDGLSIIFIPVLIYILYYTLTEYKYGQTIGKMITNTKVITKSGGKITFSHALVRSICRAMPFDSLTYIGSKSIGFHDQVSGTLVINSNE